jgi:hypothetical protein
MHSQVLISFAQLKPSADTSGFNRLFVNWHPAPLGHEVIGNQVAFYHLKLMEAAIGKVIAAEDAASLELVGAIKPVPAATECKERLCPPDGGVQCAYSFLPHWEKSKDVGDMMHNESGTTSLWENKGTQSPYGMNPQCLDLKSDAMQANKNPRDWANCFDSLKHRSYLDSKRGMYGTDKTGPIVFKFEKMSSCLIMIGEPSYEWNKPPERANWFLEMEVKINGEICEVGPGKACSVDLQGYLQTLIIDAKEVVGEKCSTEPVMVSLEIKPVPDSQIGCVAEKCTPDRTNWKDYGESLCRAHECAGRIAQADLPHPVKSGPIEGGRMAFAGKIDTFISHVISF